MAGAPPRSSRRRVHVLYLIDSLIAGGAERSLAALAPQYATRGVDLEVAYLYERDNVWRPAIEAAGAWVWSLAGEHGRPGAVRRAHGLIVERRPDVVHTTLFDADVVGRLAATGTRCPWCSSLVNEAYGPQQRRAPTVTPWKLRGGASRRRGHRTSRAPLSRRLGDGRGGDGPAPVGSPVADRGDSPGPGRPGARRTRRRAPARARAALGVRDTDELVVALGRHEYQKGFDTLLAAFGRLRGLRPAARSQSPDVRATPRPTSKPSRVPTRWGRPWSSSASGRTHPICCARRIVFVSASRWEGSPGSVIEAMALETPIVATDIPAVREVVGER